MDVRVVDELEAAEDLKQLYKTHWWFEGRDLADIRRSVTHSDECIGLRDSESDRLIAAGRVITDYVYTGKILDVIVDAQHRGQGIGTQLMNVITNHPNLQDVEELTVNCRAGLAPFYRNCGFEIHEMIQERAAGDEEDYYVMVYS